jgi:hypothetical protein
MQVVPEGVPTHAWDMPTQRIIERRRKNDERRLMSERRKPRPIELDAPVEVPIEPWAAGTPRWNRVVVVSLATFACGVLLTIAVNRLTRHTRAGVIALVEHPPAPASRETAIAAVAPVVQQLQPPQPLQPLPQPEPRAEAAPAPLPAVTAPETPPPASDRRPERRAAVTKAVAAPRVSAPAVHPRRPAPAKSMATPQAGAQPVIDPRPAKPAARRQWVDPFAD